MKVNKLFFVLVCITLVAVFLFEINSTFNILQGISNGVQGSLERTFENTVSQFEDIVFTQLRNLK